MRSFLGNGNKEYSFNISFVDRLFDPVQLTGAEKQVLHYSSSKSLPVLLTAKSSPLYLYISFGYLSLHESVSQSRLTSFVNAVVIR